MQDRKRRQQVLHSTLAGSGSVSLLILLSSKDLLPLLGIGITKYPLEIVGRYQFEVRNHHTERQAAKPTMTTSHETTKLAPALNLLFSPPVSGL